MSYYSLYRQVNPLYLSFKDIEIQIVDHQGKPWVTAEDAGRCLGYQFPEKAVNKLYRRHKDRFKLGEVAEIEMEIEADNPDYRSQFDFGSRRKIEAENPDYRNQFGDGSRRKIDAENPDYGNQTGSRSRRKTHLRKIRMRIFSLRGLDRLGILANTPRAWEFHDWLLDVIEGKGMMGRLLQDHRRLLDWFFKNRPRWRKIHDMFVTQTYSFDYISRRVGITPSSVRRAVRQMRDRGAISDFEYRFGKEAAYRMIGFCRKYQSVLF